MTPFRFLTRFPRTMIVARAPLRIPLGGGGTDLQFYSSRFGGFVLSVAVNNYAYVTTLQPSIEKGVRVKARINEYADDLKDIKNELVRASCGASGITKRLQITFSSDLSDGTGMGTSGAYTVCLMQTLSYLKGKLMDKKDLAEAAAHVELNVLERPIGKHDHYMASYGGLKLLRINRDGSVIVEEPPVSQKTLQDLKSHLFLFYTGERRESSAVLSAQRESAEKKDGERVYEYYHRIKDIGMNAYEALIRNDLARFGELLHAHWETKRCLIGGVSNPRFDKLYRLARANGAVGGKLVGAGGGGLFLLFITPSESRRVRSVMHQEGLEEVDFSYDWQGATLLNGFYNSRNNL